MARTAMTEDDTENAKLAHIVRWDASNGDLLFCRQISLRWVRLLYGSQDPNLDALRRVQKRFAQFGLQIWSVVYDIHRSPRIQLGQPGRDEDIHIYCRFIQSLGELGIPVAAYDFHPGNTYTTAHVRHRGYLAREFDLDTFRNQVEQVCFDREYSAEEMWDNYAYFIKAVLPVAEEAGVGLALHPDDPPLATMNGVARLFNHCDGYHRAEAIADGSASWGLNFCVGTWAEGGDQMGQDVLEMIHDFGGRRKILDVHFRNVSSPMPSFVETFPDDGYLDMYQVMKALREVNYAGAILPDHIPQLADDDRFRRAGLAYCVGYIRALLRRANEEVG